MLSRDEGLNMNACDGYVVLKNNKKQKNISSYSFMIIETD